MEPNAVLFIPRTNNRELADIFRKKEAEINKFSRQRVKIVERIVKRIHHLLCKSDPYGDILCKREDCLMCSTTTKKGQCRKSNVVYKTTCLLCKEKGRTMEYWGESSRSGYLRGKEHRQDLNLLNPTGHMVKHMASEHKEIELEEAENRKADIWFRMELVSQHTTAMEGQLSEALAIAKAWGFDSSTTMNSSEEYNRCLLPQLQSNTEIKMKEKEKRHRERNEEVGERASKRCRREKVPDPAEEGPSKNITVTVERAPKSCEEQKETPTNKKYQPQKTDENEEKRKTDKTEKKNQ